MLSDSKMNAITLLIDVVGAAVAHTEAICA